MEKTVKVPRKHKDPSIPRLDKNWVDAFIQDYEACNDKNLSLWNDGQGAATVLHQRAQSWYLPIVPPVIHSCPVNKTRRPWLLVNMTSTLSVNKPKFSRIKFKRDSYEREHSVQSSQPAEVEARFSLRDSPSSRSLSVTELLEYRSCYHPQCSFAYNLTNRSIRDESLLVECLPPLVYQRLAALWKLNPNQTPRIHGNTCTLQDTQEEENFLTEFMKNVEKDIGFRSDISEDLQVKVQSCGETTPPAISTKENVYLKFLKRNRDTSQKKKINLHKKTKTVTKVIIKQFLDWYQSLGGNDSETLIDEATMHELFQIGFDMPEVKSLIIGIRELPTVPGCLAALRNEPEQATRHALRQLLKQDIKKENTPIKMFAFGSMLPKENPPLRYKPPRNQVRKTWMECERVPSDLDTMKTIWGGLEKLRSTIAFSDWLKLHPEVTPPAYFQQKGLLDINYEEWNQMYKGFELDVDTVEVVASDMKIIQEKALGPDQVLGELTSLKYDSYNSLL